MAEKRTLTRFLLPNLDWLEISRLRPGWGPWPAKVLATSAFVEHLLIPMESLSEPERGAAVAKFFASLNRLLAANPETGRVSDAQREGDLLEWVMGQAELLLMELVIGDERVDLLVGLCVESEGVWHLSASGDWRETPQ